MIDPQTKHRALSKNLLLIGVKTGQCDMCKATKKVLLLKYGFTLCQDCFDICTCILQELQTATQAQKAKAKLSGKKQKTAGSQEKKPKRTHSLTRLPLPKSNGHEAWNLAFFYEFHQKTARGKKSPLKELTASDISSVLRYGGRAFLLRLKKQSIRRNNSWFRVLSLENRRFIDAVIQTLERIRSSLLLGLLKPLTEKLLQAIGGTRGLVGELAFGMQNFGYPLTQRISKIAAQWGNKLALQWANDEDFTRYVTVLELNSFPFFRAGIKLWTNKISRSKRQCVAVFWIEGTVWKGWTT